LLSSIGDKIVYKADTEQQFFSDNFLKYEVNNLTYFDTITCLLNYKEIKIASCIKFI